MVAAARSQAREISPGEATADGATPDLIIDVREPGEFQKGTPPGLHNIPAA
jgi:rhodanese-related sulfurtransferase